jgi:2-hydroxychromene-2-carboxylate isomerase
MSRETVLLYTDYKSPYAYLAKDPAYRLEREFDIRLDWRPYTLDIPAAFGTVEGRTEAQWRKVRYSYMDVRRFANRRGLTVYGPRKIFDSSLAAIGMLFAQRQGCFRAYHDTVSVRFWRRELDIEDSAAVRSVLAEVGAETAGFDDFLAGEGRAEHDRLRAEAESLGVFGVPTFVIDGELFWGHDRIDLVGERLAERGLQRRAPKPDGETADERRRE